ncbi:prephenate dehydratase [Francisella philomiragia]|uniref:Prephenate dehydratase n=1 Tax=Francisella philomiragia TaxID=28110 RepID=A0AAW3DCF6_9GAMM|nr:prephenate dehydratase [Francisella philomiragia]KFJ43606.1 prephenate dehydratase [Francisella philomiragia]MBK2254525.1 prephenate dehydratase [Francisella philomiragia]MBK2272682.1 prephenate dehydratase [Francisella philomiragia]MBK2276679.1 prephenate dehydratase [Francisella philomiragia]MBK2280800.1 prephenate dehydratase [Francisella philomiragia]
MIKVSFQGEHGAYSEQAITSFFNQQNIKDFQTIPCFSFSEAIEHTIAGKSNFVMIPVENSLAGSVVPAYDELIKSNLKVKAEVVLKIKHCLMGLEGVQFSDIKSVISHPQALSQCSKSLNKLKLVPEAFVDTAGAAKYIFEKNIKDHLAIAGELAAKTYGLKIFQDEFEDEHFNYTRFLLMGYDDIQLDSDNNKYKTTLIFSVEDKSNALVNTLNVFGKHNINLTKIESRPSRNRAWNYLFFIDFEGSEDDENVQKALLEVLKKSTFLKVLGSYKSYHYN